MRRFLLGPLIVAAVVAAVLGLQRLQSGRPSGYVAPDFTLPDLSGAPVRLADFRGRIVFLNLWATWCPPCRAEMPSMEALYRRYRGSDFAMLAVSEDAEGAAVVSPFVRDLELTFPILLDTENRLPGRYGVTGFPETFVIGRDGQVLRHVIGPAEWDSPEMLAYFESLLREHAGDVAAPNAAGTDE
ncbi:MAG: TlpA disulfide reductase family protein [Candidatus Binatia bacterium]